MDCKQKTRRVIFNNDGGDAVKPHVSDFADPREFLNVRTTPLTGSHVDTISYCTNAGFGVFQHDTNVGQTVPVLPDGRNGVIHALIERGTDPLRVMVEYGHEQGMEVFWSMRMNDTHDGGARNAWMFEANRFKNDNPECLMGAPDAKPRCGKWSAVDYASDKVRDMALAFIEEVCCNYDVDGIELDFFRHPVFFRTTAAGQPVAEDERDKMTDLVRRVARLLESEGNKRQRPFVLSVRTPDDIDYAATIGLDIERWMQEGLIDSFVPSGYFRQRSWRDNVELGRRHGVQVYAGFSESRVGGGHHKDRLRASDECYRARAANAWQAGVDGISMFNLFDPNRRVWREIGDPGVLKRLDKIYFASVRGVRKVPGDAYPYRGFVQIPTLNPEAPMPLPPDGRHAVRIEMAEDLPNTPAEKHPAMTLMVQLGVKDEPDTSPAVGPDDLTIAFNGHALTDADIAERAYRYVLAPEYTRPGWNSVEVYYHGDCAHLQLEDVMVGVNYSGELLSSTAYLDQTRSRM